MIVENLLRERMMVYVALMIRGIRHQTGRRTVNWTSAMYILLSLIFFSGDKIFVSYYLNPHTLIDVNYVNVHVVFQSENKDKVLEMIKSIKECGNSLFKEQKIQPAKKKYKKALR